MASEAARQALQQAEAEGLTLQPSDSKTGFKGVRFNKGRSRPYQAKVRRGGKKVSLGAGAECPDTHARALRLPVAALSCRSHL